MSRLVDLGTPEYVRRSPVLTNLGGIEAAPARAFARLDGGLP
jgi:hypothetical protein